MAQGSREESELDVMGLHDALRWVSGHGSGDRDRADYVVSGSGIRLRKVTYETEI